MGDQYRPASSCVHGFLCFLGDYGGTGEAQKTIMGATRRASAAPGTSCRPRRGLAADRGDRGRRPQSREIL
jgi:hypothetical protein